MATILDLFKNETFNFVYSIIGLILMIGPIIVLTRWYHARMRGTSGGRAAVQQQRAIGPYARELGAGLDLGRALMRGRYGREPQSIYRRTVVLVVVWVVVMVLWWGLLIWADGVNGAPAG